MQPGLVTAYLSTNYVVFSDGRDCSIRIGRRSLIIDRLLLSRKTASAAFITGWNPFSRGRSSRVNAYWDRELKRYLNDSGFSFLPGEGQGEGRAHLGDWPSEASVLAFDMSRARAASAGRRFRQNAIVYIQVGRPAELVLLRWLG